MTKSTVLKRCKKAVAILIAVLQLISVCTVLFTVNAATEEGDTVSRLINVVYDDSNSMIMEKSYAWSEAKYSLEILSAMMQEKDEMNVYFIICSFYNSIIIFSIRRSI